MQIGVLFAIDVLAHAHDPQRINGRAVANVGLLHALWQSACDHDITVIVTSGAERAYIEATLGWTRSARRTIVTLPEFPAHERAQPFDVLHTLGPSLHPLLHLRDHVATEPCPVTGMTHTVSHAPFFDWYWLTQLARPHALDTLVCTTPTAASVIAALNAHAVHVMPEARPLTTAIIPLGIDVASYREVVSFDRSQLQIPAEAQILMTCGRLSYYTKADLLPLLLMMRDVVRSATSPVYLVIAGAAEETTYPELLAMVAQEYGIADRVRIMTNVDDTTKRALLRLADIYVAPSDNLQETFGISVIEAMAAGCPVVAADWDGYRVLVQEDTQGFLVPTLSGDGITALAQTAPLQIDSLRHLFESQRVAWDIDIARARVLTLLQDPARRERMGRAAAAHAQQYDWSRVIAQYLALWSRLSEQRGILHPARVPLAPSLDAIFRAYPTRHLCDTDLVQRTVRGDAMLRNELPVRFYAAMEDVLSIQSMGALLTSAAQSIRVSDLFTACHAHGAPDVLRAHLLWLCKYGAMRVAE